MPSWRASISANSPTRRLRRKRRNLLRRDRPRAQRRRLPRLRHRRQLRVPRRHLRLPHRQESRRFQCRAHQLQQPGRFDRRQRRSSSARLCHQPLQLALRTRQPQQLIRQRLKRQQLLRQRDIQHQLKHRHLNRQLRDPLHRRRRLLQGQPRRELPVLGPRQLHLLRLGLPPGLALRYNSDRQRRELAQLPRNPGNRDSGPVLRLRGLELCRRVRQAARLRKVRGRHSDLDSHCKAGRRVKARRRGFVRRRARDNRVRVGHRVRVLHPRAGIRNVPALRVRAKGRWGHAQEDHGRGVRVPVDRVVQAG